MANKQARRGRPSAASAFAALGGKARQSKLSPEQRIELCHKAGLASAARRKALIDASLPPVSPPIDPNSGGDNSADK
jgi:hypothetical protein